MLGLGKKAKLVNDKDHLIFNDPIGDIRYKVKRHVDKGDRVFLVCKDIYEPTPTSVVTLTEVYDRFARGYVEARLSGAKIPYTLSYADILTHDYTEESYWEDGDSIFPYSNLVKSVNKTQN